MSQLTELRNCIHNTSEFGIVELIRLSREQRSLQQSLLTAHLLTTHLLTSLL